MFLGAPHLEEG